MLIGNFDLLNPLFCKHARFLSPRHSSISKIILVKSCPYFVYLKLIPHNRSHTIAGGWDGKNTLDSTELLFDGDWIRGHSITMWPKFYQFLIPFPPWMDNCWHFTWYLPIVMWPSMNFLLTPPPLFLST